LGFPLCGSWWGRAQEALAPDGMLTTFAPSRMLHVLANGKTGGMPP
jgi:hypothetical protein